MSVTSKRLLAIQDLAARLAFITMANGFSSDAGLNIYLGRLPKLGPDDPPAALAVFLDADQPPDGGTYTTGGTVRSRVPIVVHALARVASNQSPLVVFEGLIADIKQAAEIEGNDPNHPESLAGAWVQRYLGVVAGSPPSPVTLAKGFERGETRVHFAEGGSEITGASVEYLMFLEEQWGRP